MYITFKIYTHTHIHIFWSSNRTWWFKKDNISSLHVEGSWILNVLELSTSKKGKETIYKANG